MKKGGGIEAIVGLLAFVLMIGQYVLEGLKYLLIGAGALGCVALLFYGVYWILESIYYDGKKFNALKDQLNENTIKFNELNEHIEDLKTGINYASSDYGEAEYSDSSTFNFKRPYLNQIHNNTSNEYFCSLSVCKNAQMQPFKYLCKYFNIPIDEDSLNVFEAMLNDFSAAEEGKQILLQEREDIKNNYGRYIPFYIRWFGMKHFFERLGYTTVDVTDSHFPRYHFKYISAGGNSSMTCDIVLDIANLERFVAFLYSQVEYRKSIKYQRALMTAQLRAAIKERDNYTCQICGASVSQEPNLLLEIDHIIPISKNGKTIRENLQTLCWRCNRQKGNKI